MMYEWEYWVHIKHLCSSMNDTKVKSTWRWWVGIVKCYVTCLHGWTLIFSQFPILLFFNLIVVIIYVNGDVKEV
jgi:hypothetical protein